MLRTEKTNDPGLIAQQRFMTSVNTALEVDLFGQANASRINARIHSGFGGQTDFIVGALHSPGGQSFIALRSWHPKADVSTIVPLLDEPVTSFQQSAVVTEHGMAQLWGRSEREQCRDIIEECAHPRVRDDLWEEAGAPRARLSRARAADPARPQRGAALAVTDNDAMTIRIGLSSSSVYPDNAATAFATADRLGYDGVEIMVWTDPVTQEAGALNALAELHGIPIMSVHAPTLLLTQRVWGTDPWGKVDRSIELALEVGADTVVLHPPFRWQREYAAGFVDGIAAAGARLGRPPGGREHVSVAHRAPRGARLPAALGPDDPALRQRRRSTCRTRRRRGRTRVEMVRSLGPRLAHLHLADGLGSFKDEHLVPGRGTQPCTEVLELLADTGWQGDVVVEVSTRKGTRDQRDIDLAESLAFARFGLLPTVGASRI